MRRKINACQTLQLVGREMVADAAVGSVGAIVVAAEDPVGYGVRQDICISAGIIDATPAK